MIAPIFPIMRSLMRLPYGVPSKAMSTAEWPMHKVCSPCNACQEVYFLNKIFFGATSLRRTLKGFAPEVGSMRLAAN